MRKILFISGILILLFLAATYIFIPATITIQRSVRFRSSDINLTKYLRLTTGWRGWWSGRNSIQKKEENNKFCYKSVCHRITKMTNTGAEIKIDGKTLKINSHLIFSQISRDSIEVLWQTRLPGSFSPIQRFINYQEAVKISRNFDEILMQIKLFFDNEELVFGLNIKRDFVKNKLMIAKEKTSVKYPDINFIYLNTGISFS